MSDLFEEANSDYQYNKKVQIYKKILPITVIATIFFVIIVAIKNWYFARQDSLTQERTKILLDSYFNKTSKNLSREALETLALNKDNISDFANLAIIKDILEVNLDTPKLLYEIQNKIDLVSDDVIKNILKILYGSKALDIENLENDISVRAVNYLKSIDESQPLYYNAQIILALHSIKSSDNKAAETILNNLSSKPMVSESIKGQIDAIQHYIKSKE